MSETPSFDFDAEVMTAPREGAAPWREVPQARFLSWTPEMQLAYCMRRDLDSATCAEDDEWRQFYQKRAEGYR